MLFKEYIPVQKIFFTQFIAPFTCYALYLIKANMKCTAMIKNFTFYFKTI